MGCNRCSPNHRSFSLSFQPCINPRMRNSCHVTQQQNGTTHACRSAAPKVTTLTKFSHFRSSIDQRQNFPQTIHGERSNQALLNIRGTNQRTTTVQERGDVSWISHEKSNNNTRSYQHRGTDSEAEPTGSTQTKMSSMNNRSIMNRITESISEKH